MENHDGFRVGEEDRHSLVTRQKSYLRVALADVRLKYQRKLCKRGIRYGLRGLSKSASSRCNRQDQLFFYRPVGHFLSPPYRPCPLRGGFVPTPNCAKAGRIPS